MSLQGLTEDAIANYFVQARQREVRYDSHRGWFVWDGSCWVRNQAAVMQLILSACSCSSKMRRPRTSSGLVSILSPGVSPASRRMIPSSVCLLRRDNDPLLLGTPHGTVNLRTGCMSAAQPTELITKLTAVSPSDTEDCPRWHDFFVQATGGQPDVIAFLKRLAGYALTGFATEQKLVFLYGPGGNGKGVFLHTLSKMMGAYARAAQMSTFAAKKFDGHPEDVANLAGARLVTANETEEGRQWATARIKELTGGDPISARHLYKDRFTFFPVCKLVFAGNHAPAVGSVDDAVRRRVIVIPFEHKPDTPDLSLEEKLLAELPGILRWAMNGCLEWQMIGLAVPPELSRPTEEYLAAQDVFSEWMKEDCEMTGREDNVVASVDLFARWREFAQFRNEPVGSRRTFLERFERRTGLARQQVKALNTKGYRGIKVRPGIVIDNMMGEGFRVSEPSPSLHGELSPAVTNSVLQKLRQPLARKP